MGAREKWENSRETRISHLKFAHFVCLFAALSFSVFVLSFFLVYFFCVCVCVPGEKEITEIIEITLEAPRIARIYSSLEWWNAEI